MKEKFKDLKNSIFDNAIRIKNYAGDLCIRGLDWMIKNPGITTAVLVPTTIAAIRSSQSLIVSHRVNKQNERADRSWYDRSSGLRWDLKRKMTNNDRMAITRMKAEGQDTIDILMKLNLI